MNGLQPRFIGQTMLMYQAIRLQASLHNETDVPPVSIFLPYLNDSNKINKQPLNIHFLFVPES